MTTPQEALHTVLDAMGALGNQCVLVALVGKDEAARVFAALSQQAQEPQPSDKEKLFDYLSALAAEAGFENISAAIAQARWGAAAPAKPADDHPEIVQLRAQNDHLVALYDAVDDFLKPTGGGINATLHLRLREAFAVAKDAKPADQEKAARGRLCLASALKEIAEAREAAGKIKPSMYHFGKMETLKEIEDRLICYAHPAKQCLVMHADGGLYEHIGTANGAGQSAGGEPLEIYRGAKDGNVWYRSPTDFAGRFCAYETSGHINGAVEMVAEAEQQAPAITEQAPHDEVANIPILINRVANASFACGACDSAANPQQYLELATKANKAREELRAAIRSEQAPTGCIAVLADTQIAEIAVEVGLPYGPDTWHSQRINAALSTPPAVPPKGWRSITAPGQVKVGDKLRFELCGETKMHTVRQVLHAGTEREEIIYHKGFNWYVITSMAIANAGSQKNVRVLSAAPAAPQPQKEQP